MSCTQFHVVPQSTPSTKTSEPACQASGVVNSVIAKAYTLVRVPLQVAKFGRATPLFWQSFSIVPLRSGIVPMSSSLA
jgi:hypothetical protein